MWFCEEVVYLETKTAVSARVQKMKIIYKQNYIYIILILFLSLVACAGWLNPLFPKTHEYFAPVYTLMDFDTAFRDGNLLVNWLPNFAGGGQAVFDFYSPLAYYVSEFFYLIGFSYTNAIKCTIICSYFISGIFMFILVNKLTNNRDAAFISAAAYIFFPYHLVDSHLRGDLVETFSFIFLPIIFYYLHEAISRDDFISSSIYAGISYALLILSHILVGYIFSIFVLIYLIQGTIARVCSPKKLLVISTIFGCSALVISSFYWLPALVERDYINFTVITSEPFHLGNNYVYISQLIIPSVWEWGASGPGIYNFMPLSLGLFTLLIFISMLYLAATDKFLDKNMYFFVICFLLSSFFTTNYGLPILKFIPLMENIQFPWRFLIVAAFASSVFVGYIAEYLLKNIGGKFVLIILLFMIISSSYNMISIPGGYMDREPSMDDVNTFYRDEYLPVYTGIVYSALSRDYPNIIYAGNYSMREKKSTYWRFNTYSDEALKCEAKIFYSPRWKCFVDGIESKLDVSEMGTICLNVPSGQHVIEFRYCDTNIRVATKVITIIGLISLILILRKVRKGGNIS